MRRLDYNIVFVDDNNVCYGILKVNTIFVESAIHLRIENIIKRLFGNRKTFFEDFSANISKVIEELNKDENIDTEFEYNNVSVFNVDKVFDDIDFEYTEKDILEVVYNIINMLDNNIDLGITGIGESLRDWCENGATFEMTENVTDEEIKARNNIMGYLESGADDLTTKIYKLYMRLEERETYI